ncbi:MAG: D-amino-acid transaminase [bacterium]
MPNIAYVNGEFVNLEEAKVSVEDRGFQFADGVYEVVRTYGGIPFRIDKHMERLRRSAGAINLPLDGIEEELHSAIPRILQLSGFPETLVYIQVTRGAAPRRHAFPTGTRPTVILTARELVPPDPELREKGVDVITVEDVRWKLCNVKSVALLPNVLAKEKAHEAGAFEALLLDEDGFVNEGSSSNFFAVRDGQILTPPADHHILPGITRDVVIELAEGADYHVLQRRIPLKDLRLADEVFLTATTSEIMPVVRLDGAPIGCGKPGEVTRKLYSIFQRLIRGGA